MKLPSDYTTGIDIIDEQHEGLYSFSVDTREVLRNGGGTESYDLFLEFLDMYAKVYFGLEQDSLEALQCPQTERQKLEQKHFSKFIDDEIEECQNHGFDRQRALSLLDKIDNWLLHHTAQIITHVEQNLARNRFKGGVK